MTTDIVVATRSGLAEGPDGAKYRLARGRTLADARHPLAAAHPELFSPYTIDLPYEGDEASLGDRVAVEPDAALALELTEARATAESYREQLAAIAEHLHARGFVPPELDTEREGWLAELIADILAHAEIREPSDAAANDASAPKVEPGPLPRPRKRAPRPQTHE
jgi:hypothetical protein